MAKRSRAEVVSSFTIIKGSMIDETYAVFRDWDLAQTRAQNLARMRETNSIGATSASWLRDVAYVLRRRFDPAAQDRALVELAKRGVSYPVFKPALLWHITRDELLLRDFLTNWLYPRHRGGALRVRVDDLLPYLRELHPRGLIKAPWRASTLGRVASGLLRMAVDFGLMRGTRAREFTPYHLPDEALLYLLHAMSEAQPNAHAVVHSPNWRMFLMDVSDVERELFRLHQYRRLHYEVAGSLAQLTLPCASAATFVQEMTA